MPMKVLEPAVPPARISRPIVPSLFLTTSTGVEMAISLIDTLSMVPAQVASGAKYRAAVVVAVTTWVSVRAARF